MGTVGDSVLMVCLDRPAPWTGDYWLGFFLASWICWADPFAVACSMIHLSLHTVASPHQFSCLLKTRVLSQGHKGSSGCEAPETRSWTHGDGLPSITSTSLSLSHVKRVPTLKVYNLKLGLEKLSSLTSEYLQDGLCASKASHPHLEFSFISCWPDLFFLAPSLFFPPHLGSQVEGVFSLHWGRNYTLEPSKLAPDCIGS